ncbi:serine/threonine protein kinase [Blastomyces parvus]|uniref:non-specific serine/threonine protein kinase n=1 Tax=Blastomyces parvus TaxID=2060905 RepID=A0A2B7X5E2_9EURO|nr:serine/threonine protein kinase [Blastomyces parvus]
MSAQPRASPHPQSIFSLLPLNENAHAVIQNPSNSHLLSSHVDSIQKQHFMLNVGFQIGSAARYTLATLGRNGDIIVDGPSISRIQCSFEILPEYDVVMLYDESTSQTTQVFGDHATPFRPGCKRKVVVGQWFNNIIGMGGIGCDQVQFEMVWHRANFKGEEESKNRIESPLQARTVDNVPTVVPSQIPTPNQWPTMQPPPFRYKILVDIGEGTFGKVYKAVDVDTGRTMAVKAIPQPQGGFHPQQKDRLEREILALSRSSHRNIVEYIHWYSSSDKLLIFTALKAGGVDSLINNQYFDQNPNGVNEILHQMLQALDYLACNGVIHRDVKPANILYTPLESAGSHFLYQLTDFGLCNSIDAARSNVGSPMFQAPEVQSQGGETQTCKVDIWSLFVTVAFALNVNQYRSKVLNSHAECIAVALQAASAPELQRIQDMAERDPYKRPSAAQMLVKCYNGQGLTTPRNEVPSYPEERLPMPFPTGFPNPQPGWPPSGPAYSSPPTVPNEYGMGAQINDGPQIPQQQIGALALNRTTSALGARSRRRPPTDSKREPTQYGFPGMFARKQ